MQKKLSKRYVHLLGIVVLGLGLVHCATPSSYEPATIRRDFAAPPQTMGIPQADEDSPAPAAALPPGQTPQGPLTLSRAIELALAHNPDLQMAQARIQSAQAKLEGSAAPYYPRVSVYTEYMRGDAPSAYLFKTIDQRQLPPDTNFNDPGSFGNWESGLTANWNLYNGGRDRLGRQTAASSETAAHLDRHSIENRMTAVVIQAFYDTRAAREFIKTAQASVATVQSQLKVMNVRFAGGGALKSDILSLEVRLAQAREELVRSRNQYRIAQAALANALGIEPDPPLELADDPSSGQSPSHSAKLPADLADGLAHAVIHRPELAKVAEQLRQTRISLDGARSGYLPRVDLTAKYYLDDPDLSYDLDRDNWFAALFLNWDLFTGFSTRSDTAGATAAIQEVLAAERKALLEIKFDVQRAYLNLEAAEERLKVALSAVDKAEESLDLVKKQYEGGSATVTRYLEAELDRNHARIRAIAARYDREKTRAEIGRAIGYWRPPAQPQKDTPQP